ncbi:hypothetical protein DTO166G5_4056 [Paecilomyces variotii]|nr:hypothetical protein DTO166G5_4056 [Paecilomyces variotii]
MQKRKHTSPITPFHYPLSQRQNSPRSHQASSGFNSITQGLSGVISSSGRFSSPSTNENHDLIDGHVLGLQMNDDLPLDAFDRELLAQLNEENQNRNESLVDKNEPSTTRPAAFKRMNAPQTPVVRQSSKFFGNSNGSRTTLRRCAESSSPDVGPPSSPLLVFGSQGRRPLGQGIPLSQNRPYAAQVVEAASNEPYTSPDIERRISLSHAPPIIQGITLVPVHELPDRFKSLFKFPIFNAIQSKCFQHVYQNDYNVVVSAPTGSGKTVLMELAICRLITNLKDGQFKVVYQAPTKSLCSERFRDWTSKFTSLGLNCAEMTGDTDYAQLKSVQNACIIITTPEKWDSMTRKWKDHARLLQLVKLFLIDEVHILKETRGATLEAVVSRMKSVGSDVRFVALSATVPNSEDIATWLGKDATNQHLPAHRERFGEEFRPVKLQKFVYGYQSNGNDFVFDKVCSTKLPEVILKHGCGKPIMIFCCTRNSSIATAKELASLYASTTPSKRMWKGPARPINVQNPDLKNTVGSGVAFHHAGLDSGDRHAVETGFLGGQINIICCTSTLAVGVNLPCHLVIIKNTVGWQDGGCKEYSDLEMMQMLGRAGRPQFDDSAVAVILTRKERVHHYEKLVSGSESLESCLHLNLIDHLNAEIGLGTVTDIQSATKWLASTFLFVRMRRNPTHYQLKEGADRRDEDEMLQQICEKDIKLLRETNLVTSEGKLKATQFGDAMARYYVKFDTMKVLLSLPPKAKLSEILSAIVQAEEFKEIRLKSGEKSLYKEINRANGIKFPIKVDIALPAHKISLLIQSELGAVEFPAAEQFQKHKLSFQQDKNFVFSHVNRLIRCVIDCQIYLEDSIAVRNALELARCFGARVWDNSPLQMKQIDQIGVVAVRKLSAAGITSLEALELTEPHRIDMILSRNPPFGVKLISRVADFPKLRVTIKMIGKETKPGKPVKVNFKADIGFMNEKIPLFFQRRPVYVCFLAETSDGRMVDFRRMNANKLQNSYEILLQAELRSAFQHITCYVMCDDIAGTMKYAEIKPEIPASFFPVANTALGTKQTDKPLMNTSRRRSSDISRSHTVKHPDVDEFEGDDLEEESPKFGPQKQNQLPKSKENGNTMKAKRTMSDDQERPTQLPNGKWACNHKCKDKSSCKHFCCRDGLEKPPRTNKKQASTSESRRDPNLNQLTISASLKKDVSTTCNTPKTARKVNRIDSIEIVDLSQSSSKKLSALDKSSSDNWQCSNTDMSKASKLKHPSHSSSEILPQKHATGSYIDLDPDLIHANKRSSSSEYGDSGLDDLPSPSVLLDSHGKTAVKASGRLADQGAGTTTQDDAMNFKDLLVDDGDDIWFLSENVVCDMDNVKNGTSKSSSEEKVRSANITDISGSLEALSPLTGSSLEQSHSPFLKTGSDPMLAQVPDTEAIHGQKRGTSLTEGSEDENVHRKKFRGCEVYNDDLRGVSPGKDDSSSREPLAVPDGWEGIDKSLLEEFKDIINFF